MFQQCADVDELTKQPVLNVQNPQEFRVLNKVGQQEHAQAQGQILGQLQLVPGTNELRQVFGASTCGPWEKSDIQPALCSKQDIYIRTTGQHDLHEGVLNNLVREDCMDIGLTVDAL